LLLLAVLEAEQPKKIKKETKMNFI